MRVLVDFTGARYANRAGDINVAANFSFSPSNIIVECLSFSDVELSERRCCAS